MGSPIGYYPKSEIGLRFGRVGMVRFDSFASRGDGVRQYWVLGRDLVDKGHFFGMFGYGTYFIYATSSGSFYNTETESSLGVSRVEEGTVKRNLSSNLSNISIKAASSSPKRRKALKRVDEGGRSDHYSFHDNVRWDAWGRFEETCTAYQSWIWTASNHEIDFAPEIGEYKHRYHVPYRASGLNLSYPLTDQQLASGSSLGQSFQQAEDALTRNGKNFSRLRPDVLLIVVQ
ncbi:hypothetical protein OROMI_011129 [Orobanche minor]